MTGVSIVEQMVEILVAGISKLGAGIGDGVSDFVQALAITGTGENQTMSIFLIFVLCFAGVSLAVGLTRLIFQWLTSLGARG